MPRLQISRRLHPDSREEFLAWQQEYLNDGNCYAHFNPDPTIAIVSSKLLKEYFLSKPKETLVIPDDLKKPISMFPVGISVRPPQGKFSMVNTIFEEPDLFVEQRRELLEQNGAGEKVGRYNPNLHTASFHAQDIVLAAIAEAVNNRPGVLRFMPAEIESF